MADGFAQLLAGRSEHWLVTGAAGFIGSNLVEVLLRHGQRVRAVDNLSSGHRRNIDEVRSRLDPQAAARLEFVVADITDAGACRAMTDGIDRISHQAALGSVPRSIAEPLPSFAANADGFVKLLDAARLAGVSRFVYASSSSVYGDSPDLPKLEARTGQVLSPYAATKAADELFAGVFARCYGIECVGLRYFNVFGPRQDPDGAYAAVIPKWIAALLRGEPVAINGDGLTSRDFCYVANAVQANLRAALCGSLPAPHEVYNIAVGERTTLLELFELLRRSLARIDPSINGSEPVFRDFRAGDVRHSLADVQKAADEIGYRPTHTLAQGMAECIDWYVDFARAVRGT